MSCILAGRIAICNTQKLMFSYNLWVSDILAIPAVKVTGMEKGFRKGLLNMEPAGGSKVAHTSTGLLWAPSAKLSLGKERAENKRMKHGSIINQYGVKDSCEL